MYTTTVTKTKTLKVKSTTQAQHPKYPKVLNEDDDGQLIAYSRSSVSWVPNAPREKCAPCRGRGRHLERLDDDDIGAWFDCSCCDGTGFNKLRFP